MTFQENAWNIGDLNSFMMGYHNSDELVFSGKKGPTYGWNNIKQRYLNSYPNAEIMGKLSFDVKKITGISEEFLSFCNTSRPSNLGIFISKIAMSKLSFLRASSPEIPSEYVSTSNFSDFKARLSDAKIF